MPHYSVTRLPDHVVRDGDYLASDLHVFAIPQEAAEYIVDLEAQCTKYAIPTEPEMKKAIVEAVHLEKERRRRSVTDETY